MIYPEVKPIKIFTEKTIAKVLDELRDHDSIVLAKDAIRYIENKLGLR